MVKSSCVVVSILLVSKLSSLAGTVRINTADSIKMDSLCKLIEYNVKEYILSQDSLSKVKYMLFVAKLINTCAVHPDISVDNVLDSCKCSDSTKNILHDFDYNFLNNKMGQWRDANGHGYYFVDLDFYLGGDPDCIVKTGDYFYVEEFGEPLKH